MTITAMVTAIAAKEIEFFSARPLTTESTISPRISSITAAPITILLTSSDIKSRSFKSRAVIPTLVATIMAPINIDIISLWFVIFM
ncbi:MAG: hypothetical protein BWY84_00727 [Candidatus Aerophobetes bacterium ADurb.Bin490]|nr:MAG: hypothetical protein BWY84_00727 [Candidatus Aerophobetes bacterium ADurb.Bin490]